MNSLFQFHSVPSFQKISPTILQHSPKLVQYQRAQKFVPVKILTIFPLSCNFTARQIYCIGTFIKPISNFKRKRENYAIDQRGNEKYGKTLANDNISFAVGDGQIGILLGPNGAGKSTIIKCITGLLRFTGRIEINGCENTSVEAKRQLGYIPEMPAIYDLLTVSEHLEFIRRAYKVEDEAYVQQLLERLELWDKKEKLGKELSKGMQQKLSICCALAHKPRVAVFDEPLVGLDPHAIKELKTIFRELKDDGVSVLISTHMIDSVEDYWDVANIMMNGRFAATKVNGTDDGKTLEELFFEITEGTEKEGGAQ